MKSVKRDYRIGHYDTSYDKIIASCKKSIDLMHCEYLDVFLIHREDPLINHEEVARALNDLKTMGLIKSYGVSNFDPFKFEALQHFTHNQLVTNQIEISPLCFEHYNSGLMDVLQKHQVHPMIWSPLAGGKIFTGEGEAENRLRDTLEIVREDIGADSIDVVAFSWLLSHPAQMIPITGSGEMKYVKKPVEALKYKLTPEQWYMIWTAVKGRKVL